MRKAIDLTILAIAAVLFAIFVFLPIINVIPHIFDLFGGMALFFFITFLLIIWRGLMLFRDYQYDKTHPVSRLFHSIFFILTGILISVLTFVRCEYSEVGLLVIVFEFYCIPMAFFHAIKPLLTIKPPMIEKIIASIFAAIPVAILSFCTSSFYQFLITKKTTERLDLIFFCIPFGLLSTFIIIIKMNNYWRKENV